MENCAFCQIISGKIPCYKVYEDDKYLGILDINPLNPGHTLLMPKIHYQWTYDVIDFGEYWEIAKKVGLAAKSAVSADAISFLTMGFEISHAHIHVIPRYTNDGHRGKGIDVTLVQKLDDDKMKQISTDIKKLLSQ